MTPTFPGIALATALTLALAAPVAPDKVARARQRLTLLGAPIGSGRTGSPGSLAVVAPGRGALIGRSRGALLGPREALADEAGPAPMPEVAPSEAL